MPKLTIDGREVEAAAGTTVIRAARSIGIKIPHLCWHPELSVAANCRMCLVEMEKSPKLVAACQQVVAEGMVIRTTTPRVREARRAMMEYLLLDHPVDCPICDQAGECKLQNYYMLYDLGSSRLWGEDHKIKRTKRKVFGPHVIFDAERCVMCTRCIRVCQELARDFALTTVHRSDRKEIALAPGRLLDHPYSLMTAHVCPVGALTSRDFRFQKRVWFLSAGELICPGCATGCNAYLDHHGGVGYRLRPRENPEVNRTWLCDEGVLAYGLHNDRRLHGPRIGRGEGKPAAWPDALAAAAAALSKAPRGRIAAILSAEHTCEENWALALFAREALGVTRFFLAGRTAGEGDDILRNADRNPNRAGVRTVLGADPEPIDALAGAAADGSIRAVLALGSDAASSVPVEPGLGRLDTLVALAARAGAIPDSATVRLSVVSFAEAAGTYVNAKGRVQSFARAIAPRTDVLEPAEVLVRLARRMEWTLPFANASEAAEAMRAAVPALAAEASVRGRGAVAAATAGVVR